MVLEWKPMKAGREVGIYANAAGLGRYTIRPSTVRPDSFVLSLNSQRVGFFDSEKKAKARAQLGADTAAAAAVEATSP
jgi:hypothetical protein